MNDCKNDFTTVTYCSSCRRLAFRDDPGTAGPGLLSIPPRSRSIAVIPEARIVRPVRLVTRFTADENERVGGINPHDTAPEYDG